MAKKRTRRRTPATKQLGIRVEVDLLDKIDGMAADVGLSRTQLVNRLLRDMVRMQTATEETGLFSEWEDHFEQIIEQALSRAMREGGIDAVLYQAKQAKKAAKKGSKR